MEKDVGIEIYLTRTRGLGGRIKTSPEDFIVDELPSMPPREDGGKYTAAWIRTRNWETNRLVRAMSRELRISRRRISFAGTKDKRAVTTQLFEFDADSSAILGMRIKDVEVLDAYPTSKEVNIGDLRGNRFEIVIRDVRMPTEEAKEAAKATDNEMRRAGGFPNFFGVQRFGSIRPITHIVGKQIVKGDFKAAVDAYVANPIEGESDEKFKARTELEEGGNYAEALKKYPDVMSFEKAMLNHLVVRPDDHIGALQQLPFNLLMMFVHGYQSYLFNKMLSERIRRSLPVNAPLDGDILMPLDREGLPDDRRFIPVTTENLEKANAQVLGRKAVVTGVLFGSRSSFAGGLMGEIERHTIEVEGLKPEDFTIPKMPRLSSRGTRRALAVPPPPLTLEPLESAMKMKFELPRGCYATMLLREFMKIDPLEG